MASLDINDMIVIYTLWHIVKVMARQKKKRSSGTVRRKNYGTRLTSRLQHGPRVDAEDDLACTAPAAKSHRIPRGN